MKQKRAQELSGNYTLAGFFAGLLISLVFLGLTMRAVGLSWTVGTFVYIHSEFPLLILTDLLPFTGILVGFLLWRSRNRISGSLESKLQFEHDQNEYIKSVLHDLTIGNLNSRIKAENLDPEMAERLLSLQNRLKENLETQKATRNEDRKRNWISHGLAELGDLLRLHSNSIDDLGYAVIAYLVRYLDINQGGFFTVSEVEDGKYLDMIGCHAYERKKFPDKKIKWGEGLIGAVAIERKSYYTNRIPEGYLTITSGLGRANPSNLLIVPLVLNEEVFGIFELASFQEIEAYKIQFVERVAESTATTLNIMRSNARTAQLLRETQEQAQKLASQEEQVLQNMEALKAAQAEAAIQSEQFISFTNTVNHTLIRAEFSPGGELIYANTRFLKKLGYSGNKEVNGKHVSVFVHPEERDWFNGIWKRLAGGGEHFEGYMRHITKLGVELWTMATYTCVRKDDNSVEKILFLSVDSSEQREKSIYMEGLIGSAEKLNLKAEFSPDGRLLNHNALFLTVFRFNEKELSNTNIFDFIHHSDQERFNEVWDSVIKGSSFMEQVRMISKYEDEIWIRTELSCIYDIFGEVKSVIFFGQDLTREKQMEIQLREQSEAMKDQEEHLRISMVDLQQKLSSLEKELADEKKSLSHRAEQFLDIINVYPYPAISVNNQGIIVVFNKAAAGLWKLHAKNVVNHSVRVLFSSEQEDKHIQSFIEPGKTVEGINDQYLEIILHDQRKIRKRLSIVEVVSGPEILYTMYFLPG